MPVPSMRHPMKAHIRGYFCATVRSREPCSWSPQAEARAKELIGMGVGVKIVTIGKKAATYFKCAGTRCA